MKQPRKQKAEIVESLTLKLADAEKRLRDTQNAMWRAKDRVKALEGMLQAFARQMAAVAAMPDPLGHHDDVPF